MLKVTETNLLKELEFYSNLIAQHEKNKICESSVTSNKKSLSCSASNSMSSFLKKESNVIPNQVLKTDLSKFKLKKSLINKYKCAPKLSKNLSSNVSKNDFIDKTLKISTTSKLVGEAESFSQNKINANPVVKLSVKTSNESDSKKLMGEIMALTNQLKLKYGTYNSHKIGNHNLKLHNSEKKRKISASSSDVKNKCNFSKACNTSVSNVKYFNRNHHIYKKNPSFAVSNSFSANQLKGEIRNTNCNAQCFKKNIDPVNDKIMTTNLSMMKKLDEVKKVLANSSKKPLKEESVLKKKSVEAVNTKKAPNVINSEKNVLLDQKKADTFSYCIQNQRFTTSDQKCAFSFTKSNCQKRNKSYQIKNKFSYSLQHTKSPPLSAKNLNSKYKFMNKKETPNSSLKKLCRKISISNNTNYPSAKKSLYRLVNNKIAHSSPKLMNGLHYKSVKKNYSSPSSLFKSVSKKSTCLNKKQPCNKVFVRASPNTFKLRSKYYLNKNSLNSTAKLHELNDSVSKNISNNDVDVDLLLELAAEKKERLAMERLYKSRNRIDHSVQVKTMRMIKSKYFKTNKRSLWKNRPTSQINYEGFSRNYSHNNLKFRNNCNTMKFQSKKYFLNSQKKKKLSLEKKKIVSLEGEKFIVGSTGKTLKKIKTSMKTKKTATCRKTPLKKYTFIKNNSPASKIMASRVLNRSINQVLSASVKKKMEKVNSYCKFYNRFGRCNKGIDCSYVHDPSKIAVCTRFLRGTCKNDKCLFSHETDPGKIAICTFFLQDACTKDDCPYRHEKLSSQAELCKAFLQGYCANGKECQKAHVLICLKYIKGICDKGKDCIFPHPESKGKISDSKMTKDKDNIFENVLRYYEVLPNESSAKGLVVPRVKCLPEQPSFISLTMDENL